MMLYRSHPCIYDPDTDTSTVLPPTPVTLDPTLEFELKRRSSTVVYESGDTILVSTGAAYLDLELTAQKAIASVTVDGGPLPSLTLQTGLQTYSLRLYAGAEIGPYAVAVTYTDGETWAKVIYLGTNQDVPVGHQIEGYTPGQQLPPNDNKVTVTLGANPKPGVTFELVTLTIYRNSDGRHMSSVSYETDDLAGIAKITAENLAPGAYTIRTSWDYDPDSENVLEDTPLIVESLPPSAPGSTFFQIFEPDVFVDGRLSGTVWTDPSAANVRQWLTVDGVEHDRPLDSSLRTVLLPVDSFGMNAPGSYTLQWFAEYSDTSPTVSASDPVTVTVSAIPASDRLATATASPGDNALWQATIDAPDSTPQQRAIATDMIALNNEIAAGVNFGVPLSEVLNDRTNYLAELAAGTTAKTFSAWLQQQADAKNPIEQQDARDFVANAPTSSVGALLAYFNAKTHPYGSLIRLMLGGIPGYSSGDWTFIRNNAQSYGGSVPDSVILADYRRYQSAMQTVALVLPFEDWI